MINEYHKEEHDKYCKKIHEYFDSIENASKGLPASSAPSQTIITPIKKITNMIRNNKRHLNYLDQLEHDFGDYETEISRTKLSKCII